MITVSDFYKSIFGTKAYKISLDAGCTCPNRDGSKGTGGCIFCSQSGSGDFAAARSLSIPQQVEQAKLLVNGKFSRKEKHGEIVPKKYIAYFQNFTSTYGPEDILLQKFYQALNCQDVEGLAIGTRPDCLTDKMLAALGKIAESHFVQLELGLQTMNEKSADFCNRCFSNADYEAAVNKIRSANPSIHLVTHLIFGLPFDTPQSMLNSVKYVCSPQIHTDGIKITVLYVLQNTKLAQLYKNGQFQTLSQDEYFDLVRQAVKLIPEQTVVHRLTGDPPKSLLIAPEWTANKRAVLNSLNKMLQYESAKSTTSGQKVTVFPASWRR